MAQSHVGNFTRNYPLLNPGMVLVEAGSDAADENQFNVKVRYDASDLPIWMFSGIIPLPPKTIVRTASIKNGGF